MRGFSKIDRAFLELVRCSLWNVPPRLSFFTTVSQEDWKRIFLLVLEQTEVACCYPVVLRLPKELRPAEDLLLQWFALKEKVLLQNRHRLKVWKKLYSRLTELGFRAVVMKGWSFACYYPDPMERMSGDIDLFIPEKYEEVVSTAEKRGYHPDRLGHHDCIEYDDVHVEFHSSLINPPVIKVDTTTCNLIHLKGDTVIPVPCLEANLMVMLTHMARHLMHYGFALRHVSDFLLLWQREGNHLNRQLLKEKLEDIGIDYFFDALMQIGKQYFNLENTFFCHPDNKKIERLGRLLLKDILKNGDDGMDMKKERYELTHTQNKLKKCYAWMHYYGYSFLRVVRLRSLWPQYANQIILEKTVYRLRYLFKGQPLHS